MANKAFPEGVAPNVDTGSIERDSEVTDAELERMARRTEGAPADTPSSSTHPSDGPVETETEES